MKTLPCLSRKRAANLSGLKAARYYTWKKNGNYITVHLKDGNILIRMKIWVTFLTLGPAADFIRVHKSYVVGVRHIRMIEVHQVIVNGEKIPIGSTYRDSLRDRLGIV